MLKKTIIVVLFALAGCQKAAEDKASRTPPDRVQDVTLTPLELTAKAALEKRASEVQARSALEQRSKKAMDGYLLDPYSAEFKDLRAGRNGAVCGQVNAKNRLGAYVGYRTFVLSKDGKTIYTSTSSDGVDTEQYGSFAEAYLNSCATKVEANRHRLATEPAAASNEVQDDPAPQPPADPFAGQ